MLTLPRDSELVVDGVGREDDDEVVSEGLRDELLDVPRAIAPVSLTGPNTSSRGLDVDALVRTLTELPALGERGGRESPRVSVGEMRPPATEGDL